MKLFTAPGRVPISAKVSLLAEGSVFANLGYEPDGSRAYVECEVCHSLPEGRFLGAGGAANGNQIGLWAEVIAKSHGSLLHQQLNVQHMLAEYAEEKKNKQDRIIGCVVATKVVAEKHILRGPSNGANPTSWAGGGGVHIAALMVVHKLAKGVNSILGDHLASRKEQSVSIEMECGLEQLGVMRPSTGEAYPFEAMPEDWYATVQAKNEDGTPMKGLPRFGAIDGEQLVVTYGMPGAKIEFQGIATTPNPAENMARITRVTAEQDGMSLRIAAERVNEASLPGRGVFFKRTGRTGVVMCAMTSGVRLGLRASVENPLLQVLVGRDIVWTPLASACLV